MVDCFVMWIMMVYGFGTRNEWWFGLVVIVLEEDLVGGLLCGMRST